MLRHVVPCGFLCPPPFRFVPIPVTQVSAGEAFEQWTSFHVQYLYTKHDPCPLLSSLQATACRACAQECIAL